MTSAMFTPIHHLNPFLLEKLFFVNGARTLPLVFDAHAQHHARGPRRVVRAHVSRVQEGKEAQILVTLNETGSDRMSPGSVKWDTRGGEE